MKAKETLEILGISKQRLSQLSNNGTIRFSIEDDFYDYHDGDVYEYAKKILSRKAQNIVNKSILLIQNNQIESAKGILIDSIINTDDVAAELYFEDNQEKLKGLIDRKINANEIDIFAPEY